MPECVDVGGRLRHDKCVAHFIDVVTDMTGLDDGVDNGEGKGDDDEEREHEVGKNEGPTTNGGDARLN